MLPVCDNCFADDHEQCDQRGHPRDIVCGCACETATTARPMIRVDMQTEDRIPNYVALDLWMALGGEPNHDFDDQIALRGVVDLWAFMLAQVRALNNRGRIETATEKSVEPLPLVARAHRALDEMDSIVEVEVDYEYHDEVRDSYGRVVHGTVRSILRITGEVH